MLTTKEIQNMSREDINHMNTYLGKKLMKRLALKAVAYVVIVVVVTKLADKYLDPDTKA